MRQTRWTDGGGRSRRQFLRQSAGGVAALATTASAGCLSFLPPASRTIQYGDVDVPSRGETDPVYRRWFPAESVLPELEEVEGYADSNWMYVTPGDLGRDALGSDFDIGRSVVQSSMDYVGSPMAAYDRVVGVGDLGTVVETNVDRSTVRETMAGTGYERVDGYRDYDVYDRSDIPRLVAVADDAIVHTRETKRREKVEALVDAGAGRVPRRHEVDDAFAAYTDRVGAAPTVLDGFGLLDGSTTGSMRFTFDDSAAYYVHDHRFPDGETPSVGEVKREISDITRGQRAIRVDVTVESPHVTIALKLAKRTFPDGDSKRPQPFVTWGVDDGPDTITVRHEAGDDVELEHLRVQPSDAVVDRPDDAVLSPGDELAISRRELADVSDHIQFTYQLSEHGTQTLFHYDLENDTTT